LNFRHTVLRSAVLVALGACAHSEPFTAPDHGTDRPYAPGPAAQLTLNPGHDRAPGWLPDGSGIIYTAQRLDRADRDWCLEILPPTGGRAVRTVCDASAFGDDSTNAFLWAAVSADGRVAYVRSASRIGGRVPQWSALVVAPFDAPSRTTVVSGVPYTVPGSATHQGIAQVRWLGTGALVYRGDLAFLYTACRGCPVDSIASGRGLVLQSLGANGARIVLPGTDYASSVSAGADSDEVYYTLNGDSKVYRRSLSAGTTAVVADFGAVVRDVHVVGRRLVAIVGGTVTFAYEPGQQDSVQWDDGGDVVLFDLDSGIASQVAQGRFRNPALSPSGARIVAERYVDRTTDLWLFEVP